MYYIGIDISKFKHDCAVIDDSGEIVTPSWSFTNDSEGFSQLKTLIDSLDAETRIGLESTGHYGMNLKLFLESNNFSFMEFNPLLINRFIKSKSLTSYTLYIIFLNMSIFASYLSINNMEFNRNCYIIIITKLFTIIGGIIMKKLLSIIITLFMLFSLCQQTFAANVDYNYSSDELREETILNGAGVYTSKADYIDLLAPFKEQMRMIRTVDEQGTSVMLAITAVGEHVLPEINVYTAIYDTDGVLKNVVITPFVRNESDVLTAIVAKPASDSYKIFIWTDEMKPITSFMNKNSSIFETNKTESTPTPTAEQTPTPTVSDVVCELMTENISNPIGIDSKNPEFSWKLTSSTAQTAYRILVASSEENLENNNGDMWDSGIVGASQQYAVVYGGKELSSLSTYYWKVKIYNANGAETEWSDVSRFETALLNQNEWTDAKLAGGAGVKMVRSVIDISANKEISAARAYVSSPGFFELHINGEVIGDHVIDPVQTNPDMRLLYSSFDITKSLANGKNVVGAMLGYGGVCSSEDMRDNDERYVVMKINVKYADGTEDIFVTDDTWKATSDGPVIYDDLYYGENYDATKEIDGWDESSFDDSLWNDVSVLDIGERIMASQLVPLTVAETITPVSVTKLSDCVFVADLGKNIAGRPVIAVNGESGTKIDMLFGELLYNSGYVNPTTTRQAWKCSYILKGADEEIWSPRFAISGFRYIQISGYPGELTADKIKAELVTAEMETTGYFTSSNEMLNKIHNMYLLSQKANMSTGVPVDCPHRERLGWLGDAMLISDAISYNFDTANMFDKWFDDMNDEMERSPDIWRNFIPYPSNWATTDFDVPWFSANIQIPWDVYMTYGDKTVLEDNYTRMKKLVDDLTSEHSDNYIITTEPAWKDWVSVIGNDNLDYKYLGTGYYYHCTDLLAQIAEIIGKTEDADTYAALAENIKNTINAIWLNDGEYYDTNTQTANAMALDFGIVPEENKDAVLNSLITDITKRNYHITTGIPGTYNIFRVFTKYGKDDVAYEIMTQESYPSYGYMLYNGATTPWEFWSYATGSMNSWNHVFLTGPGESWLNRSVSGIRVVKPGYDEFIIKPAVVGDLESAKGYYDSIHGRIVSEWERNDKTVTMKVTVPPNTTGYIYVPVLGADTANVTITANDDVIWNGTGCNTKYITYEKTDGNYIIFRAVSGVYSFVINADNAKNTIPMGTYAVSLNSEGTVLQAEDYSSQSGITKNSWYISDLDPWDYVEYTNVELTNVSNIQVSLRNVYDVDDKAIDFRIDSPTGEVVATLYVVGTNNTASNATIFHTEVAEMVATEGTHNLYMTFRGSEDLCDIDYIKLIKYNGSANVIYAKPVTVYAAKVTEAVLPSTVSVICNDKSTQLRRVVWDSADTSQTGEFIINGTIDGTEVKARLTLVVTDKPYITDVENITVETYAGQLKLPLVTEATYSDGTTRSVLVNWDAVSAEVYSSIGTFTVIGSVDGYSGNAQAEVTVRKVTAPSNVTVEQIGDTAQINWEWTGADDLGTVYFEVQRSSNGEEWETIGTSSGFWTKTSIHYIDNELPGESGTYYYRVCVITVSSVSDYCESVSIEYEYVDLGRVISSGKTLTVSGTQDKTIYINDGDIHTDRYGYGSYGTNQNEEGYFVIDLGESKDISCVKFFPQRACVGIPVDFTVEVSDDADFLNKTVIAEKTDFSLPYYQMLYFEAPEGTKGRYVRIHATKLGWMWTSYYALAAEEFQVCTPNESYVAENLLADGDFENITEITNGGWKPVSGEWRSGLGASVTIDTDIVSPNNDSIQSIGINNAAIQQIVTLGKGEYTLSFDLYLLSGFDASKITFGIHNFGGTYETGMAYGYSGETTAGNTEIVFDAKKTDEWQTVVVNFTNETAGNYVTQLAYYTDGIYVDNVSLMSIE